MTARLYRVILPVGDIEAAALFYGAVLGEPGRRVSGGRHYFSTGGGAVLACYDAAADGDPVGDGWRMHPWQYVYFAVDDLAASRAACQGAGARDVTDIQRYSWGETMFYALDPFGNPISFVHAGTKFTGDKSERPGSRSHDR